MSLPAVSKHIKVLEKAGLLTKTISAQQRPCKIDGVQLKQAVDWIAQYKELWKGRLDRLDAYLVELHAGESSKVAAKNTTKKIAPQAINTPSRSKKNLKKQVKTEKSPKKPKTTVKPLAKTNDNKDINHDLQQQIGFDF